MPKRIQRRRTKGWRLPENAKCVDRSTWWGNPFRVGDPHPQDDHPMTAKETVQCFRRYALGKLLEDPTWLDPLHGKDLACFCSEDAPYCHADVLLDMANHEGLIDYLKQTLPYDE